MVVIASLFINIEQNEFNNNSNDTFFLLQHTLYILVIFELKPPANYM